MSKKSNLKNRAFRAGAWSITKRLIKPLPVVGTVFVVGLAGYTIKRKGLLKGAIDVGLSATPIIGTAKGVVEIFTGDLIPDKQNSKNKRR